MSGARSRDAVSPKSGDDEPRQEPYRTPKKPPAQPVGGYPLVALGLTSRPYRALVRAGIQTVGQLAELVGAGKASSIRNIGAKGLSEIEEKLTQFVAGRLSDIASGERPLLRTQPVHEASEVKTKPLSGLVASEMATIRSYIHAGLLHPRVVIQGVSIDELISGNTGLDLEQLHALASLVLSTSSLADELEKLYAAAAVGDIRVVLLGRYGLRQRTLQEIGQSMGITRERVRQREVRLGRRLAGAVAHENGDGPVVAAHTRLPLAKCQTALRMAEDLGRGLSYETWERRLLLAGLCGCWSQVDLKDIDVVEACLATCRLLAKTGVGIVRPPDNLLMAADLAFQGHPELSAAQGKPTDGEKRIRKRIRQHLRHTGAVNARWLSRDLSVNVGVIVSQIEALGLSRVDDDWYSLSYGLGAAGFGHLEVFHRAMRKMSTYCGPLELQSLCGGLRRASLRGQFPVPPPHVLGCVLLANGYTCEEGLYYWDGDPNVALGACEGAVRHAFGEMGPVLHHEQLAKVVQAAGLSLPALYSVLKHSPLFRRVEPGLYVLRGTAAGAEDLERARAKASDVPQDLEVTYVGGCVVAALNISVLSLGSGAITVPSRFPNLAGVWTCQVSDGTSHIVKVTPRAIAGLRFLSNELGVQPGDRVELSFDPRTHEVTLRRLQAGRE